MVHLIEPCDLNAKVQLLIQHVSSVILTRTRTRKGEGFGLIVCCVIFGIKLFISIILFCDVDNVSQNNP